MNLEVSNLHRRSDIANTALTNPLPPGGGIVTEAGAHIPVIENLTPQYMSPDAPTILIALLDQPIVSEHLGVKIKHLEGRMMHVHFGTLEEEEAVVVDELLAAVQMHECHDVAALTVVQHVAGFEIEVAGPEG